MSLSRAIRFPARLRRAAAALAVAALAAGLLAGCRTCAGPVRVQVASPDAPPPEGGRELVVLLHGMKRTPRSMEPMARALREAGYDTLSCGYPSRWSVRETAERVFAAVSPAAARAPKVHFVTHSLGGILVREAFFRGGTPANLGRVVMLAPPNGGCEHIDRFGGIPFFGLVWGTPARELGTGAESFPNRLPPVGFDCGVIAGTKGGLLGTLLPRPNDGKVTVASARAAGAGEVLEIPANHTWIMRDKAAIAATLRYLQTGTFAESAAASAPARPQN